MAEIGGVTNAGLQWMHSQTGSIVNLTNGYALLGNGRRKFGDIAAASGLQGSAVAAGPARNGRISVTGVFVSRDLQGREVGIVTQVRDVSSALYAFSELGIFSQDNRLIFYYCEDAAGNLGSKDSANVTLVYNALSALTAGQSVAGLSFVVDSGFTLSDRSVLNRHIGTNAIDQRTIAANAVGGNELITEDAQDLVGAMFTGNSEQIVSLTYDDATGKIVVRPITESLQDFIGAMAGRGITYNDTGGDLDLDATVRRIRSGTTEAPSASVKAMMSAGDIWAQREA